MTVFNVLAVYDQLKESLSSEEANKFFAGLTILLLGIAAGAGMAAGARHFKLFSPPKNPILPMHMSQNNFDPSGP